MLTWLIYRPMFGKGRDREDSNPWQEYWGESYAPELKQRLLKPVFGKLETEEKITALTPSASPRQASEWMGAWIFDVKTIRLSISL